MPLPSYEILAHVLHNIRHQFSDHVNVHCLLASLRTNGLSAHCRLCNQLVAIFMEFKDAQEAQILFRNLTFPEICHWNAAFLNYLQCGEPQRAFTLYRLVQNVDFPRNFTKHILKTSLKYCICLKDIDKGLEVHAEIARMDFSESDFFVGNMLLDLYAKCGLLTTARQVFCKLSVRDIVAWNVLIAGLTDYGHNEEALHLYDQMVLENVSPDAATFVSCLKACGSIKAMEGGFAIHAEAERKGVLTRNPVLGSALVDMYIKCGLLKKAQEAFDRLALRDTVVWTSLIAGYNDLGQADEALQCFEQMQCQGVSPDDVAYICGLKACGNMRYLSKGQRMHISIQKRGVFEENVGVGNALVDMYCRCGALDAARNVFEWMPAKDVVSWNILITGYAEELGKEAIKCFEKMQLAHVCPTVITFISSLLACGNVKAAEKGKELHSLIVKNGLLELNIAVGSVLVGMYGNCGLLNEAQKVFSCLQAQNVLTWNALITGYVEHSHHEKALDCIFRMKFDGIDPNITTFVLGLKACGCLGDVENGEIMHAELKRKEDVEGDLMTGSALVDMYAKCGSLIKAQQLFDRLHIRNVIAWTALITGYAEYGHGQQALNLFEQMQLEGVSPNWVTLLSSLKACISVGGVEESTCLVDMIATKSFSKGGTFFGNALVAAYAKCGSIVKAQEVFESLRYRDVISWNALIAGYIEHDHDEDALECLSRMQLEGVAPDHVTYLCSLKVCGKAGAVDLGQESHVEVERKGLLDHDVSVGTALVDMYARFGSLTKAQEALAKLPFRSIVSWNALISGYARLGESGNVLLFLNQMLRDGMKPDCVTFVNVLSVCNLTGRFDAGQTYFEMMTKAYGITPALEHYSCMVDLLGRTGEVGKAAVMVHRMPLHPNVAVWHALLGACRRWGNTKLGKQAFKSAVKLKKNDGAAYALIFDTMEVQVNSAR